MEFNKAYSRSEFIQFLKEFLPYDASLNQEENIHFYNKMQFATSAVKLGKCEDLDLKIFEIKHTSKNDARVGLSKDAFRMMAEEGVRRALVIFVPEDSNANYRFSFIELTLDWEDGVKIKKTYSNPRRYSYYLGEGIAYYTPNKFLNEKGRVTSVEDLRKRFSVEVLTKAFYSELSDWYAWALTQVQFPNEIKDDEKRQQYIAENTIRLVTRLIFVWFLKQKHLVPDEFFDEKIISENLLKDFNPHKLEGIFQEKSLESKYYKAILQNLFFAMLNCPITKPGKTDPTERRFSKGRSDWDNNKVMRHENMFKNPSRFLELANSTVPFLNGGLFDCLDNKQDSIYIDVFTDRKEIADLLVIPDFLFFGEKAGKNIDLSKYYGDAKKKRVSAIGIIDLLKKYNFTVEENTPFDQEVSLDPELLGKVFENLLAAYNPETKTTARKQTGSFYTPREIVQYMVDESLVEYLKKTVSEELESQFRSLLKFNDNEVELTKEQNENIINSLYACKVLDPACGSGAFPVGILQQMVHILSRVDPDNIKWKEIIKGEALQDTKSAYDEESKEEREDYLREIERSFDDKLTKPDYARKLYLIENCIFGADIQPIAIQISKLRFFISLVVDQEPNNNPADNFGIKPLPHLEANFVAANSLIPLSKTSDNIGRTKKIEELEEALKEANHKIFNAKTYKTKLKWRKIFEETKEKLKIELGENGFLTEEGINQIDSWDPFNQNGVASFFDPEWMFNVQNNFDIVIANPPYVIVSKDEPLKSQYEKLFTGVIGDGKRNLFHFFFEKGISLLKKEGVITFITPDTFLSGNDTKKLREYFIKNTQIKEIILYSEKDKVFENVTQAVAISVMLKDLPFNDFIIFLNNTKKEIQITDVLNNPKIRFRWSNKAINRIQEIATKVSDYFDGNKGDVNLGTKKSFFRNEKLRNSLPLIRGVQIYPYANEISHEWCLTTALSTNLTNYERIVFQEIANMGLERRVKGTILKDAIVGDSCNFLIPKSKNLSIKASLALINSKVINFYFKFYSQTNHVPIGDIKDIPFPKLSSKVQRELDKLVIQIFDRKTSNNNAEINDLENEIDKIVFQLYKLKYDEVLIIEPGFSDIMTEEEYKNFKID